MVSLPFEAAPPDGGSTSTTSLDVVTVTSASDDQGWPLPSDQSIVIVNDP